jgi:hypothetical protein
MQGSGVVTGEEDHLVCANQTGLAGMRKHGHVHFFCVTDFAERCNEKEAKFEETNFVEQVL